MRSLFLLTLFAFWLSFAEVQALRLIKPAPISKRCIPSIDQYGHHAICGGFVGAQCPNPTDTCVYPPGADYGPCCLKCDHKRTCYGGKPCGIGQVCNYSNGPRRGVCCFSAGGGDTPSY